MGELKPCIYREIIELFDYCKKLGINAELIPHFDGYVIRFPNGSDFIQHKHSYGCNNGCVEPAVGSRLDYSAVPLKNAKALVRRHRDKLCRVGEGEKDG